MRGNLRNQITAAATWLDAMAQIESALRSVAGVPLPRIAELVMEVIDVYSHRLDAWITSLASRRLAALRADGVAGVRIGGYGWVEDLQPARTRDDGDLDDGGPGRCVRAGRLHPRAVAAARGHRGRAALGFTRPSRRRDLRGQPELPARPDRPLAARRGTPRSEPRLAARLPVRAGASRRGAGHRNRNLPPHFPAPAVPEPAHRRRDEWRAAPRRSAHATSSTAWRCPGNAWTIAHQPDEVAPIVDDLADALDAVGDLLLAESVHQLVGGNPLRAGMAADTLGRGGDVPDTFHVLTHATPGARDDAPHRHAAAGLGDGSTGWPSDALSKLEPVGEAWVAHLLGPADGWTLEVGDGSSCR